MEDIEMNNTPSKNDIGYLTEAVIEMVDVINEEAKEFRYSFEDSRDFNATIADWSAQFLDWWDAEAEADHLHDYLESIRDFTLTKVRAETENEITEEEYLERRAEEEEPDWIDGAPNYDKYPGLTTEQVLVMYNID